MQPVSEKTSVPLYDDDTCTNLPIILGAAPKNLGTGTQKTSEISVKLASKCHSRLNGDNASDSDSDSSQSSYSSESGSVFSKAESSVTSFNYNAKRAIALTATATTYSIILSATNSVKLSSLGKQIQADMKNHGKQVLLEKGAIIPHISITVDDKCAHDFASKAQELHRTNICDGGKSTGATAKKLQRLGVPTEVIHEMITDIETQVLPRFAKHTVHTLLVNRETKNSLHSKPEHVPVGANVKQIKQ
jgi:hypothetical protein